MGWPSRKLIQRFAITFGLAAVAIGTGLLISSSDSDGGGKDVGSGATAVSIASDPTAELAEAKEVPEAADLATTTPTTTTTSITTVESTVSNTLTLRPLPIPDVAAYCARLYGAGSSATREADVKTVACVRPSGAIAPIESAELGPLNELCKSQFGIQSFVVQRMVPPAGIRCGDAAAVKLAPLDEDSYDSYCAREYRSDAQAALVADDSLGWRCAGISNGVFQIFDVVASEVCQVIVDPQTYAVSTGSATNAWSCYGLR